MTCTLEVIYMSSFFSGIQFVLNTIYSVLLVSRMVLFEMEKGKNFVQFSPI